MRKLLTRAWTDDEVAALRGMHAKRIRILVIGHHLRGGQSSIRAKMRELGLDSYRLRPQGSATVIKMIGAANGATVTDTALD